MTNTRQLRAEAQANRRDQRDFETARSMNRALNAQVRVAPAAPLPQMVAQAAEVIRNDPVIDEVTTMQREIYDHLMGLETGRRGAAQNIQQPIQLAEHETLGALAERLERERNATRIYNDGREPLDDRNVRVPGALVPRVQSLWRLWKREPGQPRVSVALFKTHYAAFQTICQLVDNTSAHYWVAEERTSLRDRIPETGLNSREAVEQRLREEQVQWVRTFLTPEPRMPRYTAVMVPPTPETTYITFDYAREDFEANPAPVEERH